MQLRCSDISLCEVILSQRDSDILHQSCKVTDILFISVNLRQRLKHHLYLPLTVNTNITRVKHTSRSVYSGTLHFFAANGKKTKRLLAYSKQPKTQTAEKGCRFRTFKCERDGSLQEVNDRARDTQKGRKMRPYMLFGGRSSKNRTYARGVRGLCAAITPYSSNFFGRKITDL